MFGARITKQRDVFGFHMANASLFLGPLYFSVELEPEHSFYLRFRPASISIQIRW